MATTLCVLTGDPRLPDITKPEHRFQQEDLESYGRMCEAFGTLPGYRFEFLDEHTRLFDALAEAGPDLVLNFCDTGYRNVPTQELHIPALLEMLGIPYSGASPQCMALCYDKALVRLLAESMNVPVPREITVEPSAPLDDLSFPLPALIKPNQADGSLGITRDAVVRTGPQARDYLARLRIDLPGRTALVQEYLPGAEYSVGLIGNPSTGFEALPMLEVDYSGLPAGLAPILAYESKSLPDSPYWTEIRFKAAQLAAEVQRRMIEDSRHLFRRLDCRDYARFDFRVGADGVAKLLEVNPNPAWSYDGKLALMAGFGGMSYAQMLGRIVQSAVRRCGLDPD